MNKAQKEAAQHLCKEQEELLRLRKQFQEDRNTIYEASEMYDGYRELAKQMGAEITYLRMELVHANAKQQAWKSRATTAEDQLQRLEAAKAEEKQ